MKKFLFSLLFLIFSLNCYSLENILIGEWDIYKIEESDRIVDVPSGYDYRMIFYETYYIQYQNYQETFRANYTLHDDKHGKYIKLIYQGRIQGQLFTIISDNIIRWDLIDERSNKPIKLWMKMRD